MHAVAKACRWAQVSRESIQQLEGGRQPKVRRTQPGPKILVLCCAVLWGLAAGWLAADWLVVDRQAGWRAWGTGRGAWGTTNLVARGPRAAIPGLWRERRQAPR